MNTDRRPGDACSSSSPASSVLRSAVVAAEPTDVPAESTVVADDAAVVCVATR